jgi:uncharacterized RDD family membrane protein YckC
MPPGQQTPPPAAPPPPPPQQGWQSTPQQPGPPPMGGGQPGSGTPTWTSNLTARDTMAGPGGIALADGPSRYIALFIDFLILGIVGAIVNEVTKGILGDTFAGGLFGIAFKTQSLVGAIVTVVLMLVLTGIYFVYTWTKMNGQTLGMRVLKLSVRDAATGGPVTQSQAITRWVFLGLPWAINFLYGWTLGLIISVVVLVYYLYLIYSIATDPMRQGLHDKQAKTVVAKIG